MTSQLLLPSLVAPGLLTLALLALALRWHWLVAVVPVASALLATAWLQGLGLAMLDGFWLLALAAALALKVGKWWWWAVAAQVIGLLLVRRFADSIEPLAWLVHGLMLLLPLALLRVAGEASRHWAFAALVASIASLVPIVGLGGSAKMAQMLGALASATALVWLFGLLVPSLRTLSQSTLLAAQLPAAWLALSAFHLAATSPLALALPALYWLLIAWRHKPLWQQAGGLVVITAVVLTIGLWIVWPEQSLY